MPAHTSMLHVRVDDGLKSKAAATLAGVGPTPSDAVRILLTRIAAEGGLPAGLAMDRKAYDTWFRDKVREALDDSRSSAPRDPVMDKARALIDARRRTCV